MPERHPLNFAALALLVSPWFLSTSPAYAATSLSTPTNPAAETGQFTTIGAGLSVSGYTGDIRVEISTNNSNGLLRLSTVTGLVAVTGYDNSSSLTTAGDSIAFEGSQTNSNIALATLEYKGSVAGSDNISVRVTDAGVVPVQIGGNFHYYGLGATGTYTWSQAGTHLASNNPVIAGSSRSAWLATVGSASENQAITEKLNSDAWIGGSDSATAGTWKWVTSNAVDGIGGQTFWLESGDDSDYGFGSTQNSLYANWYDQFDPTVSDSSGPWTEPNNYGGAEYYAYMYSSNQNEDGATWNDEGNSKTVSTYVWEFASSTDLSTTGSFNAVVSVTPASSSEPSASAERVAEVSSPGIFLAIEGKASEYVQGRQVHFGSYAIRGNARYLLSISGAGPLRILDSGFTPNNGSFESAVSLPNLSDGRYKLSFVSLDVSGTPLTLTNHLVVGPDGVLAAKSPESLQPFLR